MQIDFIPIKRTIQENEEFANLPSCQDSLYVTIDFYEKVGFVPPWICYYAKQNNILVGGGGFKGQPINGKVEIAYGTFETFRKQGIATAMCKQLVELASRTNASVKITARTLPENSYSTRVLKANNFKCLGIVDDPDDGPVWEWEFAGYK